MGLMETLNKNSNLSTYNKPKENNDVEMVNIKKLKIIENQFFKNYKGERYEILKDSIKNIGIITPLIVRKINDDYIILSGRHRYNIAKELNLIEVPCVIKYNISDDEANLIFVDSNLAQRDKLFPSELSKSFKLKNDIMNKRGFRSDIFKGDSENTENTLELIGKENNMSRIMVFNYIKLCNLNDELLDMVDDNKIALSVGFILSSLNKKNQKILTEYLNLNCKTKITVAKAKEIKNLEIINNDILDEIFNNKPKSESKIEKAINTLSVKEYFKENTTDDEIIQTIRKALDLYFKK